MAGLGFKDFAVSEVLTAADVDGYLMQQSVMRFADSGARGSALGTATGTAVPLAEGMVTYLDDANQIQVYSGASWVPVGGQVVQTVKEDSFQTTSGTIGDVTGVSVSLTPSSTASRVLVTITGLWSTSGDASPNNAIQRLYLTDGSNNILVQGESRGSRSRATTGRVGGLTTNYIAISYLHSPASVSQQTYKLRASVSGGYSLNVGRTDPADADNQFNILVPTVITAMEVA